MKKLSLILLSLCLSVAGVQARKWLPAPDAPRSEFRLMGCTYRGADLESLDLLSAAGEADIGVQFPNTDLRYSGISSLVLLKEVDRIVRDKGFSVLSLSAVLICERPRLAPYLAAMKENIASALGLSADQVGLTVTTNEGLGFTGREEGVAAHAVCLLEK